MGRMEELPLSLKLTRNPTWGRIKPTKHRELSKHGIIKDEQEGITVVHRKSSSDVETQVCGDTPYSDCGFILKLAPVVFGGKLEVKCVTERSP